MAPISDRKIEHGYEERDGMGFFCQQGQAEEKDGEAFIAVPKIDEGQKIG